MSIITENILKSIDDHDVVSFDVFDTLILRPYLKPTDHFLHIEKILGLGDFAQERIKAEHLAWQQTNDDEIQLDEIYQVLDHKYKKAFDCELELESRVCQTNQEIYTAYEYALKKKKGVIFIVDTYLPYKTIGSLLKKAEYPIYDYLFVSSYYKKTKASGKLFEEILYTLSVDPKNVLHIGDDIQADYETPQKIGINAILYPKVKDRFFEEYPNLNTLTKRRKNRSFQSETYKFEIDPLAVSVICGINIILWINNHEGNYWYKFGHIYAAPLLYAFTQWVYDTAKTRGIKDIAFVARDGYNLIRIFELLDSKREFNAQYIYLPRNTSMTSLFQEENDMLYYLEYIDRVNINLLLQDFSKTSEKIKKAYSEYINTTYQPSIKEKQNFILNNKNLFIEEAAVRRKYTLDYLKGMKLLTNDLIIVDFSTRHASSQKFLKLLIDENDLPVKLYGLYYVVSASLSTSTLLWESMTPEVGAKYTSDRFPLVEFSVSSPENPILSIKKEGEAYEPVYQNMDGDPFEAFRKDSYVEISRGVVDFARKTYDIFGNEPVIDHVDTITKHINNLINNPSEQDVANFKHMYHSWGHDDNYIPLIGHSSIKRLIFIRKLRQRIPKNIRKAFRHIINTCKEMIFYFRLGK